MPTGKFTSHHYLNVGYAELSYRNLSVHQVNCGGSDAFGRRRRQAPVDVRESVIDGQLREEIMVQSNSILALDRVNGEGLTDPTEGLFTTLNIM